MTPFPLCTCDSWQKEAKSSTFPSISSSFRFCPWCGKPLTSGQPDKKLLAEYRQRIEDDFLSEDEWGMPQTPSMMVASRSIHDYRDRTGDLAGTLDLMLLFVEMGTKFTNLYGDIDEPFYEALETMLDDFRDLLLANPDLYETGNLSLRLTKLSRNVSGIGWGYGDYVMEQVEEIQVFFGDV